MQKRLDAATRAGIAARQQMIAQQEFIVRALRVELESFVAQAAGVDLVREHWELDLEHGLLERKESADNGE